MKLVKRVKGNNKQRRDKKWQQWKHRGTQTVISSLRSACDRNVYNAMSRDRGDRMSQGRERGQSDFLSWMGAVFAKGDTTTDDNAKLKMRLGASGDTKRGESGTSRHGFPCPGLRLAIFPTWKTMSGIRVNALFNGISSTMTAKTTTTRGLPRDAHPAPTYLSALLVYYRFVRYIFTSHGDAKRR